MFQMKQDKYLKSSNIVIVHAEDVTNNYKEIYPRFTESLMHVSKLLFCLFKLLLAWIN